MLPAFTCESTGGNLCIICLGVNILRPSPYSVLYLAADTIEEHSWNDLTREAT